MGDVEEKGDYHHRHHHEDDIIAGASRRDFDDYDDYDDVRIIAGASSSDGPCMHRH